MRELAGFFFLFQREKNFKKRNVQIIYFFSASLHNAFDWQEAAPRQ